MLKILQNFYALDWINVSVNVDGSQSYHVFVVYVCFFFFYNIYNVKAGISLSSKALTLHAFLFWW